MVAAATPADRARAERAAQGLPPTIEDPATLARIAAAVRRSIAATEVAAARQPEVA